MADALTSDPKQQQYTPFKASDILSIGSIFGDNTAGGGKRTSLVDGIINSGVSGAMAYEQNNIKGATPFQKGLNKNAAIFSGITGAIGAIPGGALFSGALEGANLIAGKLAKNANRIGIGSTVGTSSGYSGTASGIGEQASNISAYNNAGGTKLFGNNRSILNDWTKKLKGFQSTATKIVQNSKRQMAALPGAAQNQAMQNEITFQNLPEVPVGKSGLKINTTFLKEFKTFKAGGKIDEPKNVIVDGKLHKELNHMEDVTGTEITRKGIPVLEMEKGGELGEQTAELERDEIIFHLQLTKTLEELEKENTDESMIQAGKILAKEILKNTKDSKSKLLKTIQ